MEKVIDRTIQGAKAGGIIGAAVGAIISVGATAVAAPVSLPVMGVMAVEVGEKCAAGIGTLIGAVTGAIETILDKGRG